MRRKNAGVKVGEDRGVPIRRPDSPTGHLYSKSKSKNSCLLLTPAGADSCWCWCRRHSQHSTQQLPSSGDPKTPCPGRAPLVLCRSEGLRRCCAQRSLRPGFRWPLFQ
ncbi:uncharacterized protein LOC126993933 isoform X5 [Eriocheir sinensis]|uniref:uncharacterized protein LOC126993933 isoform X5 n=1 Tax=Eriocheir sinensis TaxID=95602 RepID=UPI0021C731FE|nr:uncharacterized protein LOC126993933 isoform X5 [Eriocheir sinensis]